MVDLPPLAPVVDVRATTHLIDSFIFVIEWGRTKIDVVEHALGQAQGVYENLLGVVLNKVDMNIFGRYASTSGGLLLQQALCAIWLYRMNNVLAALTAGFLLS